MKPITLPSLGGMAVSVITMLIVPCLFSAIEEWKWKRAQHAAPLAVPTTNMTTITPRQLNDRIQQGKKLHLLDVRTPAEHAEIHVPGVHLAPLDRLDAAKLASVDGFAKDQPLYIFCRSGNRAKQGAEKLEKSGYAQCRVVEGGTMAWAEAGLPVNRGTSKVISLERQVRIAAGGIVLTGVLLAHFVIPPSSGSPASSARGSCFAGITDSCGMGMLIAKMPWNQRGVGASCAR